MPLPPYLSASSGGTVVDVFVQPKAATTGVVGVTEGPPRPALKLKVRAIPERGKANRATEELVAETLGVPRSAVSVIAGHGGRRKRVAISGIEPTASLVN